MVRKCEENEYRQSSKHGEKILIHDLKIGRSKKIIELITNDIRRKLVGVASQSRDAFSFQPILLLKTVRVRAIVTQRSRLYTFFFSFAGSDVLIQCVSATQHSLSIQTFCGRDASLQVP